LWRLYCDTHVCCVGVIGCAPGKIQLLPQNQQQTDFLTQPLTQQHTWHVLGEVLMVQLYVHSWWALDSFDVDYVCNFDFLTTYSKSRQDTMVNNQIDGATQLNDAVMLSGARPLRLRCSTNTTTNYLLLIQKCENTGHSRSSSTHTQPQHIYCYPYSSC
jgi:hypothetical protein